MGLGAVNACRFTGARGHVESWFLRANDPGSQRAFWLKLTISAPLEGAVVVETWFVWFDGETGATAAHRGTWPHADAKIETTEAGVKAAVAGCAFEFGAAGSANGEVQAGATPVKFSLRWSEVAGPWSQPMSLMRHRLMLDGPLPRFKHATPHPALQLTGTVVLGKQTVDVGGWLGSQGHNWGNEHAVEYAWGQCFFPADATGPGTFVEGGAGRIKVAGVTTPSVASLVVRRGEQEFHFDRVRDLTHHVSSPSRERWALRIWGAEGEARLRLEATGRPMVCLGYPNPNGRISYCFNSKLAEALLEVRPARGEPFICKSAHGAALEFLRPEPDPKYPVV